MPDITMCPDVKCPSRHICYRYMAKANPLWQSYFSERPKQTKLIVRERGKLKVTTSACSYFQAVDGIKIKEVIRIEGRQKLTAASLRR